MKRHPVDSVSLVFALLFSAAVAWWGVAMISRDPLHVPAAWIGAGTLLVIGLVGLMSALRPERKAAEAPLTVPQTPQPAIEVDPYNDPFLASVSLPRVDGVLDADAIAAAYREAGFEDAVPVSGPNAATAVVDRATPVPTSGAPTSGAPVGGAPVAERPVTAAERPVTAAHAADGSTDAAAAARQPTAPVVDAADTVPLAERPARAGDTKELPAERDGRATS